MSLTPQHIQHSSPSMHHNKCALVIHGLNTNPNKMEQLASVVRNLDYKAKLAILAGHRGNLENDKDVSAARWQTEFTEQWRESITDCRSEHDERILIGYSLGALVAMNAFDSKETKPPPTKMVLIAPALELRYFVSVLKIISWIPGLKIPSLNNPEYRAQSYTSMRAYDALFQIHDEWQKSKWKNTGAISTIVALSSKDELVDSKHLSKKINEIKSKNWKTIWLDNQESKIKPKYHHLIIDEESLGSKSWNIFTEEIKNHLK